MQAKGYAGRLLRVDLTRRKWEIHELDDALARKFIGGVGLAAKILWNETRATTDPLSPESLLLFMVGPYNATPAPSSGRYCLIGLSPLTGIWGEAHAGGSFGYRLKQSGLDGIVVSGSSDRPVCLWIDDGRVALLDASHLWGKDTYETTSLLKTETAKDVSVACIGPAGEKGILYACVMNDGKEARAAARCGLGAVMGAKRLKAVAVRGTWRPRVHDRRALVQSVNDALPRDPPNVRDEDPLELRAKNASLQSAIQFMESGFIPVKNYLLGEFPTFMERLHVDVLTGRPFYCRGCRIGCPESRMLRRGRRPVYELYAPLGSQCLVDDFEVLGNLYEFLNRQGLDAISTGCAVAFAIECFQEGLISLSDTGGLPLSWGDPRCVVALVETIARQEGFGRLLGLGVKRAAEKIGAGAQRFALHVKGLELPAHDGRAYNTRAVELATSNRGACHTEGMTMGLSRVVPIDFGYTEIPDAAESRFQTRGKAALTATMQNFGCMVDSLVTCKYLFSGFTNTGQVVQPSVFVSWLNAITGWNLSFQEFLETGERIFNLKRMINVRRGIRSRDDTLPGRILTHRLETGGTRGHLPPLDAMLTEYFESRGWRSDGVPAKARLEKLGLLPEVGEWFEGAGVTDS